MAIFLDHNSTTPCLPEVWDAMRPWAVESWANPASAHGLGRAARRALETAREEIASFVGAWPDEVVFTSGATEANAMALAGLKPGDLVAASNLEHPSIRENLLALATKGILVHWLPKAERGIISPADWADLCPKVPNLQVVTLAGHETGAIQDLATLRQATASRHGEPGHWHLDATQAVGKIPVDFHRLEASTLSFSAHKFFGPKGVGALLARRGTTLTPLLHGGGQQQSRRSGTEPVALAVGMALALRLAVTDMATRHEKCLALRDRFKAALESAGPWDILGPDTGGLSHVLLIAFPGVRADMALMALDLEGVACSAGAACSSGSMLPSPALELLGVPKERMRSVVRFSMGPFLNGDEVTRAGEMVAKVIRRLRGAGA
jgi:cysteine desulfurase